ncbi:pyridoxamine 5'-phosphate oxidase-domain-containing protein [Abortiporus biennis]|nr:pyridoxamine 5'-phosphate oxidase-domain-containing protein [Abortiporus biennis]
MSTKPRWIDGLLKALSLPENKDQTIYQIATIDSKNKVHVRSHVNRDILFPKNHPSLPILITTTDVRSPKVTQMLSHPEIELAWWIAGSQDQFRISGTACIIPAPNHPFHIMQNIPSRSALATLTGSGEENEKEPGLYDWEKKRRDVFNNDMSRHMKAGWATPTPGSVISSYDEGKSWPETLPKLEEAETEEDKKNLAIALSNFALIAIEPLEVDWVQLGITPNKRTKFTRDGEIWLEEILVP